MDKSLLRKKYQTQRDKLSDQEIDVLSQAIANKLIKLPIWKATYYSLFLPIIEKKEIDTQYILHILQGYDKDVCLPKVVSKNTIKHYLLTDNTLIKENAWGIPEPQNGLEVPEQTIEVVFVPLLAFDKKGHRLGYGKGFYDLFLSKCRPNTLKIGLSLFEVEETVIETIHTDIPLDYCVTPKNTYTF